MSIVTIVTAAVSRDFTTVATAKDELGITGTAEDARLLRYIRDASAEIETYTKRKLPQETVQEVFRLHSRDRLDWPVGWESTWGRASGPMKLRLARYPVASIDSATEGDTALTASDYELDADTGQLWRLDGNDNRQPWARAKITLQYTAGYELLATLPRPIEQACLALVKIRAAARKRDDPMVRVVDIPGVVRREWWVGSVGDQALPDEVCGLLDPLRDLEV